MSLIPHLAEGSAGKGNKLFQVEQKSLRLTVFYETLRNLSLCILYHMPHVSNCSGDNTILGIIVIIPICLLLPFLPGFLETLLQIGLQVLKVDMQHGP
jgi:hypothetical protein